MASAVLTNQPKDSYSPQGSKHSKIFMSGG